MWIANVIIYRNLAYVPVMHLLGTGGWYTGEPVTVCPVEPAALARVLEKVRRLGNPPISAAQVAMAADPILRSTGAPTWGRMALHAVSYEISQGRDDLGDLRLAISRLDERGRFVDDPAKERHFPADAPLDALAAAIVADWAARTVA